jgi:hypothetical protein
MPTVLCNQGAEVGRHVAGKQYGVPDVWCPNCLEENQFSGV